MKEDVGNTMTFNNNVIILICKLLDCIVPIVIAKKFQYWVQNKQKKNAS